MVAIAGVDGTLRREEWERCPATKGSQRREEEVEVEVEEVEEQKNQTPVVIVAAARAVGSTCWRQSCLRVAE